MKKTGKEETVVEQQKTKACVTADPALKLRAEPDGEVLAKIPYREVVEVLELDWDTEWAKISYNGTVGYVMMKYIKITEGSESFVITAEPKTYKAKEEEKDPEKETGMFANVGEKIKGVTAVFCVIGMIVCGLAGLLALASGAVLQGLLIGGVGCLACWIGSLTIYGFGEIITELKKNNELNRQLLAELRKQK